MSATHESRVAAVVAALHAWDRPPPPGMLDQLGAASRDAFGMFTRIAGSLAESDPRWPRPASSTTDPAATVEGLARVLVAVESARWCSHLRTGGPQPAVARLTLRRVDCRRCVHTVRKAPPDEDDRCDYCGDRGVTRFWPVVLDVGLIVAAGDACETCGTALRAVTGVMT